MRRLKRRTIAKSEFLSSMSHELRTPLHAILGFAQLMDGGRCARDERAKRQHRSDSQGRVVSVRQLIDEILDFALIEAGSLALSPEPVPLGRGSG